MVRDALEELLRAWGLAQIGRYAANDEERAPDKHPISRARQFAPGTRKRAALKLVGRDGHGRRKLMAQKSGVKGLRIAPMWSCDPVAGKQSRIYAAPEAQVDFGLPPEVKLIDPAAIEL